MGAKARGAEVGVRGSAGAEVVRGTCLSNPEIGEKRTSSPLGSIVTWEDEEKNRVRGYKQISGQEGLDVKFCLSKLVTEWRFKSKGGQKRNTNFRIR